jgi:pimeloyl-ACP methyl ester carboxylesterase
MPSARVGDNAIYYELHGEKSSATPAVLIMGLGTDAHGWERQVPVLAADRPVLVLDNRGVGRSAKPKGPYTTAELADDVAGVMDAAGVRRAHVVGLSLGGMIAQEVALRHPDRTRSLALVATYGRADTSTLETAERGASAMVLGPKGASAIDLASLLAAMADGKVGVDFGQAFAFLMPLVFTPQFLVRESAFLGAFYARSMEYGLSADGFAGQVAAAVRHDALGRLAHLDRRTLVLVGTDDRLIPPSSSRLLAETIPGARLVELQGATHGLNFENADAFNEALTKWLREND